MKVTRAAVAVTALCGLMACGGGGGGDGPAPAAAPYRLTFSPATLTVTGLTGVSLPLNVTVSVDRPIDGVFNAAVIDSVGVITPALQLAPSGPLSFFASMSTLSTLPAGSYRGAFQVRLCRDNPLTCAQPLPGSPWALPYDITVLAAPPGLPPVVTPPTTPPPPPTTPPPALSVQFTPGSINVEGYVGELPSIQVSATAGTVPGFYAQWVVPSNLFQPVPPGSFQGSGTTSATLAFVDAPPAGTYNGNVQLRLCQDMACQVQYAGSPFSLPYSITVRPSTNLTPLQRLSSVPEWAQHQGNASHTGHVPVTLDATRFNRRWKWTAPTSLGAAPLHPVVTDDGSVFAVNYGYFSNTTLFALSENDRSLRWQYDFPLLFAVNPPATNAGRVYLTTGGSSDAALWSFSATSGGLQFKTPFPAQAERYYPPTIANGAVYNNAGTVGGLYSFNASTGAKLWDASLQQYDLWTPAVSATQAFAYMPNGLNVLNASTGAALFTIPDPSTAVLPYSILGAPLYTGGSVIVLNGPNSSASPKRLVNFDLGSRTIKWSVLGAFRYSPAFFNGAIYTVNGSSVQARREIDGTLLWSWTPNDTTGDPFEVTVFNAEPPNIIVTNNLVFVSTAKRVYALTLQSGVPVWSHPETGRLALSPNGILYIVTPPGTNNRSSIVAINLQ